MKSDAFKKVSDGMQIRIGKAGYLTLPNAVTVTLDDVSGAKVLISVRDDLLKIGAFTPEIPDGVFCEFNPEEETPMHLKAQSLEMAIAAIRCQANGRL